MERAAPSCSRPTRSNQTGLQAVRVATDLRCPLFGIAYAVSTVTRFLEVSRMARPRTQPASEQQFECPECGRSFARAAALGAHRRQAHGVVGTSGRAASAGRRRRTAAATRGTSATTATARSRSNGTRTRRTANGRRRSRTGADRDALLKALFPNGIPPREDVIRAVNAWLDEAERLARLA